MIFTCLLSALIASLSPPSLVPVNHWTTPGPPGAPGATDQVAVDPASGTVYAVVEVRGSGEIFETTDSGRAWTALSPQPGSSASLGVAANPRQAGHLLATNGSGVARSVDGGKSWNQVLDAGYFNPVVKILFDPSRDNVAYAVGPFQLVRTLDDGASWDLTGLSIADDKIQGFAVAADGRLFVALYSSLVMSTDEGVTWSPGVFPASPDSVRSLVADPLLPGVLYAVTFDGLFRSTDRAGSWSRIGKGIPTTLAIEPADPATLYAGNESGIWKSTDTGLTWEALNVPLPPQGLIETLTLGPSDSTLWVGTLSDGIFRSEDKGGSWTQLGGGLPGPPITAIAVDPLMPETVYVGGQSGNLPYLSRFFRSADAGRNGP